MTTLMSAALPDASATQTLAPTSPTAPSYTQQSIYPPRTSSARAAAPQPPLSHDAAAAAAGPSLECPPSMTYAQFVDTWMDAQIARWLAGAKCGHQAQTFAINDIRGDVLLELDQPTLKEMGITSIGDRVRIMNALKLLRQKCASSRAVLGSAADANRQGTHSRSASASGDPRKPDSVSFISRLASTKRPAPLQLSQATGRRDLPHIVRDGGLDSARARHLPLPTPNSATPSSAAPLTALNTPAVNTPYSVTPGGRNKPSLNLPHITEPIPPSNRTPVRGYRPPTQAELSSYASAPLPPPPPSSVYGLPADPRPNNVGGAKGPLRAASPLSSSNNRDRNATRSPVSAGGHARHPSLGTPTATASVKLPPRPSTGGSAHPYAVAGPNGGLGVPQPPHLVTNLSPIAESFGGASPVTPAPPSSIGTTGYSVGRGPFNRPTTPAQSGTTALDEIRRKLVKFLLPDEGRSFTLNVADCTGGIEVLEKALKKFGKIQGKNVDHHVQIADGGLVVDGWGVYVDWGQENQGGALLSEADLLAVCHANPDNPIREHGLTLRKIGKSNRAKPLHEVFGDSPPAINYASPTSSGFTGGTDESPDGSTGLSAASPMPMHMRRASSISILSGLGVPNPEKLLEPPTSPTAPTSVTTPTTPTDADAAAQAHAQPTSAGGSPQPRSFVRLRPPSELITTHLPDYFPGAERKVLARTRRHSVLRTGKRDSAASWATAGPRFSRFSVSTQASGASSLVEPPRGASPPLPAGGMLSPDAEPPRVSLSTDDGRSIDLHGERPPNLPPVDLASEPFSKSMESLTRNESLPGGSRERSPRPASVMSHSSAMSRSSRMSYLTELRSKRDVSDTASILTVDQITEKVENRRASKLLTVDGGSSDDWTKVGEEESDDETASETVAADEDDDTSVTSMEDDDDVPDKTAKKWIKGALIGAGSFGQVYLGMEASSGLLMAVKQVELPKGSTPNEGRKKDMFTALEREIELLQDLQHDNIVQYLYSSTEEHYLNIFLEYVPGGSITALLRNYGAFEEPLVRNFLRQTLHGLEYLHAREIIHRDIKGANILVDNKGNIKISDFGISKKATATLGGNRAHRPSLQGSVFWMAPEVVKQTAHTAKADIWSVGCLVVEMFTGEHPWAQLSQFQAMFKMGMSAKPEIPSDISTDADNFIQLTFDLDYEQRPSATECLQHPWLTIKPPKSRGKAAQVDA